MAKLVIGHSKMGKRSVHLKMDIGELTELDNNLWELELYEGDLETIGDCLSSMVINGLQDDDIELTEDATKYHFKSFNVRKGLKSVQSMLESATGIK